MPSWITKLRAVYPIMGRGALVTAAITAASVCAWNALAPDSTTNKGTPAPVPSRQRSAEPLIGYDVVPTKRQPAGQNPASVAMENEDRLGRLQASLTGGTVDDQIEAIKVFAQIGSAQQKGLIVQRARDGTADPAVRIAAIENMDWNTQLPVVAELIQSDPDVAQATLYIAAKKDLAPESVTTLAQTAAAAFSTSKEASWQLATLHFLRERDSEWFDSVVRQASLDRYSPAEYAEYAELVQARNQEQRFAAAAAQSN